MRTSSTDCVGGSRFVGRSLVQKKMDPRVPGWEVAHRLSRQSDSGI